MIKNIENIYTNFIIAIEKCNKSSELEDLRVSIFGKKGSFTEFLKNLTSLSQEEKSQFGKEINIFKEKMYKLLDSKRDHLLKAELDNKLNEESIDISLPGKKVKAGSQHPINMISKEIKDNFVKMGFSIVEGPEIETVFRNFDALNTPAHHPSRSNSDTFYFNNGNLLRTHTTTVQVRCLEEYSLPIIAISNGKVYRPDYDATHTPMFHQVDGIFITKDATFANLKAILDELIINIFPGVKTRFRPHFFPFTEPSAEMDMSCQLCEKSGCKVCKGSGWIEVLGCGMVSPEVLKHFGYSLKDAQGFAFGMGVERLAMIKYGIKDLRSFYTNDFRLIKQFK